MWDDYDSDYDFEGTGSGDSYDSETYSSYGKNEERSKHNGMTFQRGYNIFFTAMAMLWGVTLNQNVRSPLYFATVRRNTRIR